MKLLKGLFGAALIWMGNFRQAAIGCRNLLRRAGVVQTHPLQELRLGILARKRIRHSDLKTNHRDPLDYCVTARTYHPHLVAEAVWGAG
jgi:hypothetical protein